VETSGAIAELRKHVLCKDYPHLDLSQMKIYLIESNERVLAAMSPSASVKAKAYLEKLGVIVMTSTYVDKYDGTTVHLRSGETIESYTVVWSAGVTGNMLEGMKPEWTERGHYIVDGYCRVIGATGIFAIGDISVQRSEKWPHGLPGQAQPAIQMGHFVGKYLNHVVRGKELRPFAFFDKGALATVGRGKALADLRGNIRLGGRIAWYIWLFVHITGLMSFRSKLLVFTNWIWNYFTFDKGNRLIIRPFVRPDEPE
jgi:NADH dehydrogenase